MSGQLLANQEDRGDAVSQAWKLIGRDTAVGRELYNLYVPAKAAMGRSVGVNYSDKNKQDFERKLATGWTPKPIEQEKVKVQKPNVNVPKFRPKVSACSLARVLMDVVGQRVQFHCQLRVKFFAKYI